MTDGTLDQVLHRTCVASPAETAVRSGTQELTYQELERAAIGFASGLQDVGVRRGDRVAIALPNCADAAVAIYGTLTAGAVIVPLNPTIKAEKLAAILKDCSAAMLVCAPPLIENTSRVRDEMPELRIAITGTEAPLGFFTFNDLRKQQRDIDVVRPLEIDLAAIIYTSGSTGMPKGVVMTHRNMVFAATCISDLLQMSSADRVLCVIPLSFDYGLYQLFLCVQVGAMLLLEPGVGYPGRLVSIMSEQQVTGLPGVPTLFRVLLSLPGLSERDWRHLRFITSTGAVLSKDTIQRLRRTFPKASLYSMYGLTECKRVSYLPPSELDRRPDSVGIPIPGTDAWIEDETGHRLGPGGVGQLVVRGPHVMQRYWNDLKATSERLREGQWPWERTLVTGDLFRTDDDGFLYFVGRQDDIIKSRGEKISPREVEDVLLAAPGVLHAAVVGIPHELLGQAVCAHVSPQPGVVLQPHALNDFCRTRLEDHVVPHHIVIHEQLPRTPNGKIDRRALAEGNSGKETTPSIVSQPDSWDQQKEFAILLQDSQRLLGCRATDVPVGVSVADWLHISRFVEATGDENPLYLDIQYGAQSWWRTLLAPPAFVLSIQVPESAGALTLRKYDAVETLKRLDLWWTDHIKLGDRVSADLHIVDVNKGPVWRNRDTVEIRSQATYKSERRPIASATGLVQIHPVRLGHELFVERVMHSYTEKEIEQIEKGLDAEPEARGARSRFHADITVGDRLPQIVRGPLTWSELITWTIAEGRSWPAGNIHHRDLLDHPGNVRPHGTTGWPVSDRKHAREDLLACANVGFRTPCARGSMIVALVAQLITTWMGDDAFLRHLSTSLDVPLLYGDTLWLNGHVTDKFVQEIGTRDYFAVAVAVSGVNQIGQRVVSATAIVLLPNPGRPLELPVGDGQS